MPTKNLSIGLLKDGFNPDNALIQNHGLSESLTTNPALPSARIFTRARGGGQPWWVQYLSIPDINGVSGADGLAFFPIDDRWAYLNFGFAYHKVDNSALVYDFGMKTAAIIVDPESLRSTDSVEPNVGRRRKTQVPKASEVVSFNIDSRASLIKGLVGKASSPDQLGDKVKLVSGGSHLKLSSNASIEELYYVLVHVVRRYINGVVPDQLQGYLQLRPVDDPGVKAALRQALIDSINSRDLENTAIFIPDTVEYGTRDHVKFLGYGRHQVFEDIYIGALHEYLENRAPNEEIDDTGLTRCKIVICDEEGENGLSYPLEKSLFFEHCIAGTPSTYYLSEGTWYEVSDELIQRLEDSLSEYFITNDYPDFNDVAVNEAEYNEALANHIPNAILLDQTDILPWTTSKIEPCDVASLNDGVLALIHVKRKTSSQALSHLFNQGVNSWRAINESDEVREKFLDHCEAGGLHRNDVLNAITSRSVELKYVITTHKDKDLAEKNLPIFSRISVDRTIGEALDVGIEVNLTYVSETNDADADGAEEGVIESG